MRPKGPASRPASGPRRKYGRIRGMTSRERVLAVFAGEIPDRVPAWLGASPEWKALAKARAGLATDEELSLFVGDDFRRVYAKYAGPPEFSPDSSFSHPEATARTPFGVERTGYGYGQPARPPAGRGADGRRHRTLPLARPGLDGRLAHPRRGPGLGRPVRHPRRRLVALLARRHRPAGHGELHGRAWSRTRPSSTPCSGASGRLLLPGEPAHLRRGGRRHRHLLHRQRFRHPERPRRRRGPLPPLLPAPPRPTGRPGPRLRAQGHDALLRRLLPAHPGHDRGRDRRPPGPPARRPGHGPGQAQGRVRRPRRLQRLHRHAPLAHRGHAGPRPGRRRARSSRS